MYKKLYYRQREWIDATFTHVLLQSPACKREVNTGDAIASSKYLFFQASRD